MFDLIQMHAGYRSLNHGKVIGVKVRAVRINLHTRDLDGFWLNLKQFHFCSLAKGKHILENAVKVLKIYSAKKIMSLFFFSKACARVYSLALINVLCCAVLYLILSMCCIIK